MSEYWNSEIIYSMATELVEIMEHEEERHLDNIRRLDGLLERVQSHCPHREAKSIVIGRRVCPICYALLETEDSYNILPEFRGLGDNP